MTGQKEIVVQYKKIVFEYRISVFIRFMDIERNLNITFARNYKNYNLKASSCFLCAKLQNDLYDIISIIYLVLFL